MYNQFCGFLQSTLALDQPSARDREDFDRAT
jgi:hypothetical protein